MTTVTDDNLEEILKDEKPLLIKFGADWCAPCSMIENFLDDVQKDLGDEIIIGKVEIGTNEATTKKFGVKNIPTCILLLNGEEKGRFIGVKNLEQIKKFISDYQN
jgi:thioredoxin 1